MAVTASGWNSELRGWVINVDAKTAGTMITGSSTEGGLSEYYPGGPPYGYVNGPDAPPVRLPYYTFLFTPYDGLDWSMRDPNIDFTATTAAGGTSSITYRSANPGSSGSSSPLDPNQYPASGSAPRNLEMQVKPSSGPTSNGWAIDVLQAPSVTITAATPYGALMRWPGTDAGTAEYLWTPNGSSGPPIVVLTAHYADGRTTTITYSPPAPAPAGGGRGR